MNDLLNNKNWHQYLKKDINSKYFQDILKFIKNDQNIYNILPAKKDIFKVFNYCSLNDIKVVILGQDPYYNINQANGIAFSVNSKMPIPPSLINIFNEIENSLHITTLKDGDLSRWLLQGVFLLNSCLTVREGLPASHKNIGWETFTDSVIKIISDYCSNIVFMLWGNYAKSKKYLINSNKHLILSSSHPSPLSSYRGFLGCKHFFLANEYLKDNNINPIIWI